MAGKLTWEWMDNGQGIVIHKKRGKLTQDEIFRFLHDPEQARAFDGMLAVILFRVNSERDMFDVTGFCDEPEGDDQDVYMIGDDSDCPICGKNTLYPQYCPNCGEKIKIPKEG